MLPVPPRDEVDLWIATLTHDDQIAEALVVDADDRARLARIIPPERRRRFAFGRLVQRHVLGRYVRAARVRRTPNGKPWLDGAGNSIRFSASGSRGFCAVAVSGGAVGADIVAASVAVDLAGICARFVPGGEGWERAPDAARRQASLWRWARFEAAIKLRGGTLLDALTAPREQAREPGPGADLIVAHPGYVCAIAKAAPFRISRLTTLSFAMVAGDGA